MSPFIGLQIGNFSYNVVCVPIDNYPIIGWMLEAREKRKKRNNARKGINYALSFRGISKKINIYRSRMLRLDERAIVLTPHHGCSNCVKPLDYGT